jgi:hypothetical protein
MNLSQIGARRVWPKRLTCRGARSAPHHGRTALTPQPPTTPQSGDRCEWTVHTRCIDGEQGAEWPTHRLPRSCELAHELFPPRPGRGRQLCGDAFRRRGIVVGDHHEGHPDLGRAAPSIIYQHRCPADRLHTQSRTLSELRISAERGCLAESGYVRDVCPWKAKSQASAHHLGINHIDLCLVI